MELHRRGRYAEAGELYQTLLRHSPESHDIRHLFGLACFDLGRREEGITLMEEALRLNPSAGHYYNNLGSRLIDHGDLGRAVSVLTEGVARSPDCASTRYNLGNACYRRRDWAQAIACYQKALALQPAFPPCELQLGMALHGGGRAREALEHYRRVLAARPDDYAVLINYGALLQAESDLDGAIEAFRAAVRLAPEDATPLNNLAVALKERGDVGEAVRLLRRCTELRPAAADITSNLILTMHYDQATTDAELAAAHRDWNARHGAGKTDAPTNDASPGRRLRIGFVSADFRDHVVGRALLPSFLAHDRASFEIVAYASGSQDALTARFRAAADLWRDTDGVDDEKLAAMIRADRIDILIDLGLHTSDNRLPVFARRPAPVQVSWLGFPETSGLAAMDYRLTDARLEPPEGNVIADKNERAWPIPDCWTCYEPPADFPEVGPLPCADGRPFTFVSLNNSCKIHDDVLGAWARILRAMPSARLLLLAKQGSHRRRITEVLARQGVAPDRLRFADYVPAAPGLGQGALLARYHEADLALDTFPYGGMTTTLDALWMGVPVVSLVGRRNLGRAGLSLLSNVGLAEFAVADVDAYVETALRLAADRSRLAELRAGLRDRMRASPLLDAAGFTRKIETAFRGMWLEWCGRQGKVA